MKDKINASFDVLLIIYYVINIIKQVPRLKWADTDLIEATIGRSENNSKGWLKTKAKWFYKIESQAFGSNWFQMTEGPDVPMRLHKLWQIFFSEKPDTKESKTRGNQSCKIAWIKECLTVLITLTLSLLTNQNNTQLHTTINYNCGHIHI